MGFLSEVICGFVMEMLMVYPGAFMRWVINPKQNFSEVASRDNPYNYLLSFLFIVTVGIAVALCQFG